MTTHWLPEADTRADGPEFTLRLAEERAALLARYWDDRESKEANLAVIEWWLRQTEKDVRT